MTDVRIEGLAPELRELARRLDSVDLDQIGVVAALQVAPLLEANARTAALNRLPRTGGLNRLTAATPMRTQGFRRRGVSGVRIVAQGGPIRHPAAIDRGRVYHPTYGRPPWRVQHVRPGWFTDPMKAGSGLLHQRMEAELERELRKV